MKTQKCLSPTKENMSPTKQAAMKNPQVLAELLAFVKASGLKIPAQLQKHFGNEKGFQMKLKPTQAKNDAIDSVKKLKVRLGDTEFQLKKLEEDFAQYKHQTRLDREKEVRKWEQAYNQLKSNLESNSQDSSLKLINLRQSTDRQIASLKEKHEAELKQSIDKLTKNYEEKLSSLKKLKERQVSELKEANEKQISDIKQKYQQRLIDEKNIYDHQVKRQALKYKDTIEAKEKQFQSVYTALQSEKKTEQKLHEKTKIQASQAKEKLYSDLYFERNVKKDLQETIVNKEKQIKALKSKINDLQIEMHVQKEKAVKKNKQTVSQYEKRIIGIEQLNKESTSKLLSAHDKQLRKYEQKIHQLTEFKEHQEMLMKENYEQIEKRFDERPSRKEDLDMIEKLRNRLLRKEQEVRILNKELKNCALQIENKEETYNKIFTSNTVNKLQKRSLTRDREDFKSRDSLCRKSQTTDIKFLLKVYNKHI